ncbi:hypothetical protein D3C87_87430 [compost metagenome]
MTLETSGSWLPLTEYSTKHRISVSTLRRRIKAEDIKFRFEDGKYFIMDEPMGTHQKVHRPSQDSEVLVGAHHGNQSEQVAASNSIQDKLTKAQKDEPILTAANKLLNELKKAYTQILHEKEEQILHLKEEVTDLKTLVRVLESENDRLKGYKQ